MKNCLISFLLLSVILYSLSAQAESTQPKAIDNFELDRYLGDWYEIARTDNKFERNLTAVRANYSLREDEKVRVINKGYSLKKEKWKSAEGKAKFAKDRNIGHLEVSFFWIFYSDYIIYEIDDDYQYAFVAGDSSEYLWLLARDKTVSEQVKQKFIRSAKDLGIKEDELIWVEHSVEE